MISTPEILTTTRQEYAALRLQCPTSEISQVMHPGLMEVFAALKSQSIPPAGPWFTHHFQRPIQSFDFEIGVPIATSIQPEGRVELKAWPAMKVARTVYSGNYSGLAAAWGEFEQWMKANQHTGPEQFWERYLVGPNDDPAPENWRTELNWPLAK